MVRNIICCITNQSKFIGLKTTPFPTSLWVSWAQLGSSAHASISWGYHVTEFGRRWLEHQDGFHSFWGLSAPAHFSLKWTFSFSLWSLIIQWSNLGFFTWQLYSRGIKVKTTRPLKLRPRTSDIISITFWSKEVT